MPDQQTLLKFIGPPLQESFMAYCGYDTETAARGVEVFRERYEPVGQYENQPRAGSAGAACAAEGAGIYAWRWPPPSRRSCA